MPGSPLGSPEEAPPFLSGFFCLHSACAVRGLYTTNNKATINIIHDDDV